MYTIQYCCTWVLLLCAVAVNAQNTTLKGRVVNSRGVPVQGVNVFIKGTVFGASTLADGTFSFTVPPLGDTVLIVRHISMQTLEIPVNINPHTKPVAVRLEPRYTLLDEAPVNTCNHRTIDHNRSITLATMDVDTSPGSDGDVTTALRQLPGVQTVGESGALFVRGGSAEESKTFIDGLEITHPYFSGIPDIAQRSRYSPHLFEGITFSTGGYAPAYGGALSAILSLDSRQHPQKSSTILALLPYGVQVGHDQLFNEKTSAGIDVAYSDFGPYYRLIHHRTDWTDAPENWMANANFRRNTRDGGIVKWYGYGNVSSQAANLPDVNEAGAPKPLEVGNRNAVSLLTFERPLLGGGNFYAGYGFNFNEDNYRTGPAATDTSQTQHQLRLAIRRPVFGHSSFDVGAEGYAVRFAPADAGSLSDYKGAVWGELSLAPHEQLSLRPGIRLDYSSLLSRTAFSPRITASYQLSMANRLSLAAGRYTQQPAYRYLTAHTDGYQRADHYIANFQHTRGGYLLRLEAYHKDYKALIRTLGNPADHGKGIANGVDIFWRDQQTVEGLDYWLSYTYLHTRRIYLGYPVQAMPTFATPHTLHVVAKQFIRPLGVFVGASYAFATGRPYFNPNNPIFLGDRTPAYHQVNLNAALLRKWGDTFVTIVAAVNNVMGNRQLFNYHYADDGSFRLPVERPYGRALLIAAFISFGKDRSEEILNQLP